MADGLTPASLPMTLDELIERNDLDELVREVERRCAARNWDGLVTLRDRCRAALERGRQLWPVASLAEYRLALEAPGRWAASVLTEGAGRFALGPLTEVVAASHTWDDIAPDLAPGPLAGVVAHEQAVGDEWKPGELGDVVAELRWYVWARVILAVVSPG